MRVAGLLLAAGAGRRMGRPKALVPLGGVPLVHRAVDLLLAGGCRPVLVVVGAAADQVTTLVEGNRDVRAVPAPDWAEGVGASLRAGLRAAATTDAHAVVVTLVDQPGLGAGAIQRLIAAATVPLPTDAVPPPADALVATYGGAAGHPVLLGRAAWADVAAAARGEVGARAWLRAHPERVRPVPCDGTGSPEDVDTAGDLAAREDTSMDVTVTDNPGRSRYEALTPQGDIAGFVQYQRRRDRVVLVHTEVLPDYEGQGVASRLAKGALDHVRGLGLAVVPTCPYISAYIGKHPEYAGLVVDDAGSTAS